MDERRMEDDIREAQKRLRDEIREKEKEADDRLDQILAKRKIDFCPRCGSKTSSAGWAGRCMHEGCAEMLCSSCWAEEGKRYCKKHEKDFVTKEEATADDAKNLTLNYMDFVQERLKKFHLDWNHEGYIRRAKAFRKNKRYGEFEMLVCERKFFSKKPKVRILVRPLTEAYQNEINTVIENSGESDVYTVFVFLGGEPRLGAKAVRLAGEFSNKKASLFVMDMESGRLNFNASEKLSERFSFWLDPSKVPVSFSGMLAAVAESVSGRKIVHALDFGRMLGKQEEEAAGILRKSGLLEEAKGTNSFIMKE